MGVNILQLNNPASSPGGLVYNYGYDQLNRLVGMDAYNAQAGYAGLSSIGDCQERAAYDPNGNIVRYTRNGTTTAGITAQLDNLSYSYDYIASADGSRQTYTSAFPGTAIQGTLTNRLNSISDPAGAHAGMGDIASQSVNNYAYDQIGNLTGNAADGIGTATNGASNGDGITWTVYGKIASISKTGGITINYTYDAAGNRIGKAVTQNSVTSTTWYVRDASGNVMSIYTTNSSVNGGDLMQTEIPLYGSSRLGELKPNWDIQNLGQNPGSTVTLADGITLLVHSSFTRGQKTYELTNHLGNVMVTVSDQKTAYDNGTYVNGVLVNNNPDGIIDGYTANVVNAQDYYPFGMPEPGRQYTATSGTGYRFGFNGQENSDELGTGLTTAEFWEYDARIGRRWNTDPVFKAFESPYAVFEDNPVVYSDPDGDVSGDEKDPNGQGLGLPNNAVVTAVYDAEGGKKLQGVGTKALATPGAVQCFKIGGREFQASYFSNSGKFAGYYDKDGKEYYRSDFADIKPEATGSEKLKAFMQGVAEGVEVAAVATIATAAVIATCGTAAPLIIGIATATSIVMAAPTVSALATGTDGMDGHTLSGQEYWHTAGGLVGGAVGGMDLDVDALIPAESGNAIPEWNGPVDYSPLDLTDDFAHTRGTGKKFTEAQKIKIREYNRKMNGGLLRHDVDGTILDEPGANPPGQPKNMNRAEIDHIQAMKHPTNPGSNRYENARVISARDNLSKSNH